MSVHVTSPTETSRKINNSFSTDKSIFYKSRLFPIHLYTFTCLTITTFSVINFIFIGHKMLWNIKCVCEIHALNIYFWQRVSFVSANRKMSDILYINNRETTMFKYKKKHCWIATDGITIDISDIHAEISNFFVNFSQISWFQWKQISVKIWKLFRSY